MLDSQADQARTTLHKIDRQEPAAEAVSRHKRAHWKNKNQPGFEPSGPKCNFAASNNAHFTIPPQILFPLARI